jgi:hypothetical protein
VVLGFIGVYQEGGGKVPLPTKSADINILKKITERLTKIVQASISRIGSEWSYLANVDLGFAHIPALLSIAFNRLNNLLVSEFLEWDITAANEDVIMLNLVSKFITHNIDKAILKSMILETARAVRIQHNRYDFNDLNYGIDFGQSMQDGIDGNKTTSAFNTLLMRLFNPEQLSDKSNGNLKLHYSKFCYKPDDINATQFMNTASDLNHDSLNVVDADLSSNSRCRKWLWSAIAEFEDFCYNNGHQAIGIIPWKLLTIKFMPVYKDPNFLESSTEALKKVIDSIQRAKALESIIDQLALLEEIYPPKVAKNPKKKNKNLISTADSTDDEIDFDFGDSTISTTSATSNASTTSTSNASTQVDIPEFDFDDEPFKPL